MQMRSYFKLFQAATKMAPKITQVRISANAVLFHCKAPSSEFQAPSSKLKCWDVIKSKLQVVAVFQAITKTAPKITQIRLHANALLFHCNLCGPKYGT